jgi:hypothetical protein
VLPTSAEKPGRHVQGRQALLATDTLRLNPIKEVTNMNDEQRIRDRAYEIWEAKGRPEGQEGEHWEQARDEMEPFYKEGDATAGSVESSVSIPMPKPSKE